MDQLEDNYRPEYEAWKQSPSPETTGSLLRKIQPAIDRGIMAHVGRGASPTLRSHARRLALGAIRSYDPSRARLTTHVVNNLQGLKRLSMQQQQVLSVPERVRLDQSHVHRSEEELLDQLGRPPSLAELADHTGLSIGRLQRVRQYKNPISEGSMLASSDEGYAGSLPTVSQGPSQLLAEAVYHDADPINQKILEWSLGLHGEPVLPGHVIATKLKLTPGAISQRRLRIQQQMDELAQLNLLQ